MTVGGWTKRGQLRWMMRQVHSLPDHSVIAEVGVWQGRSALAMGEACRGTNKCVYAIDPWHEYETMKGPLIALCTDVEPCWGIAMLGVGARCLFRRPVRDTDERRRA